MPLFLKPKGSKIAVAVCDRCHLKRYAADLVSDVNAPGLRVCPDCADVRDPYRIAPRKPENIVVPNPRIDEPLTVPEE